MREIRQSIDLIKVVQQLKEDAIKLMNKNKPIFIHWTSDQDLTKRQKGAMYVWFDKCAKTLNDANQYYKYVHPIKGLIMECEWDKDLFKRHIYKPTLENLRGNLSTEDQSTLDPNVIAEAIARAFASIGVPLPMWPSIKHQ